ncbi:hypothetical protein MFIFM68171_02408 [Madurella fahalii]|uniref:Uncharacterized protein n=1 Tax=Madurella fahalii TaxID=1157608 RepID=A0ABQ0G360_9PEZI
MDLHRNRDDLIQFLYDTMVIMRPELRQPAQYCHEHVPLPNDQDRSPTPTPASYAQGYGQGQYDTERATVLLGDAHTTGGPWPNPSPDYDESAEIRRHIKSDGPPPDSQGSVSFHDSWLQDPLHPLSGGSAAAALGQEFPDSRGWATQLEGTPHYTGFPDDEDLESPAREARKRSTRQSKSSSSSGARRKHRSHTSVAAGSSSYRHYEEPEPETSNHGQEQNYEGSMPLLPEVPNWAESGGSGAGQAGGFGPFHNGDTFAEDAAGPSHTQGWLEAEWESPWTESEARMAESVLFDIR